MFSFCAHILGQEILYSLIEVLKVFFVVERGIYLLCDVSRSPHDNAFPQCRHRRKLS